MLARRPGMRTLIITRSHVGQASDEVCWNVERIWDLEVWNDWAKVLMEWVGSPSSVERRYATLEKEAGRCAEEVDQGHETGTPGP